VAEKLPAVLPPIMYPIMRLVVRPIMRRSVVGSSGAGMIVRPDGRRAGRAVLA
jgi:hypothetical protein